MNEQEFPHGSVPVAVAARVYADLWKVKHAMAREQAVGELEGLREETQQNIAKLREEADQELTEYRVLWQEKMNQVIPKITERPLGLPSRWMAPLWQTISQPAFSMPM